ncbi:MAG: type II secretion system F family protein, partial [Chloroflexota bacterium]
VEAGLAFESSLMRVGERWDNPLTYEFRLALTEMRLGTPRDAALTRIVERTDVQELRTFVAILVQANQLGLSIADVLHSQAEQIRWKRRQRAEELAAQAGLKMLLPLVFLIFPNVMIVTLGPLVPVFIDLFGQMTGGG